MFCINVPKYIVVIAVGDRMFFEMKDFDFAQVMVITQNILDNNPKFWLNLPKFFQTYPDFTQICPNFT